MTRAEASRKRCAIYTRKSSEEGLEQEFNSLAAVTSDDPLPVVVHIHGGGFVMGAPEMKDVK